MSLPDLHRHLDGSLRRETLHELAAQLGVHVPDDLAFSPGIGLSEALARFEVTLAVLQTPDAVERVASEICEDAAAEGVSTLEIRVAPQLHRGATIDRIVDAAASGVGSRAGLILCGLYGEPPEVLAELVRIGAKRPAVVGIDLAGGPTPAAEFSLADYRGAFRAAAGAGLGRTVHAAEGRRAEEIRVAIEILGAQRIGHGTTLLEDPRIVELVVERGVTIEACPTSNVHTGIFEDVTEHPLARWLERGIKACVNTDNTLLSEVDAPEEHRRARTIEGMDDERLAQAVAFGHAASFR